MKKRAMQLSRDDIAKIEELERRCPGARVDRARTDDKMIYFEAPSSTGGIHYYVVDLQAVEISLEEWLDDFLAMHAPAKDDVRYGIICRYDEIDPKTMRTRRAGCGRVQIGYKGYISQMHHPDARWLCPRCGSVAAFDDDRYESFDDDRVK